MTNYFALILLPIVISLVEINGRTLNVLILNNETNSLLSTQHCSAFVQTESASGFHGASAASSVYKPTVQGKQWSDARIKLSNGPESIEGGWMVNPAIFHDNEAHLYVITKVGSSSCINLACPGFVQVSTEFHLGAVPPIYSAIGGQQFVWTFYIEKHQDDGNWWLSLAWDYTNVHPIGYWPRSIFKTSLADSAAQVSWGGEVGNPDAVGTAPIMGNGLKADDSKSAFFDQVRVIDGSSSGRVQPQNTQNINDCNDIYTAIDNGDTGSSGGGRVISYGGSR